jgi:hypothetical protein
MTFRCLDSSSSESSTSDSSSSEESDKDSDTVEMIHVDENVCPADCSRDLYEEAFIVRNKRYEMEFRIHDEQKMIDIWQRELDFQRNRLKTIELELQNHSEKLDSLLVSWQSGLFASTICLYFLSFRIFRLSHCGVWLSNNHLIYHF